MFIGRIDNVINSGGIKIHPEELETRVSNLFHNKRFFFSSLPPQAINNNVVNARVYIRKLFMIGFLICVKLDRSRKAFYDNYHVLIEFYLNFSDESNRLLLVKHQE